MLKINCLLRKIIKCFLNRYNTEPNKPFKHFKYSGQIRPDHTRSNLTTKSKSILFPNRKTNLTFLACIIYLSLINLSFIGISHARYSTTTSGFTSARVAKPFLLIDGDLENLLITTTSKEVSGEFEVSSLNHDSSTSYYFTISNTDNTTTSEISLRYSIIISSTNNNPFLSYSLACTEPDGSPINESTFIGKHVNYEDSYIIGTTVEGGELPCNTGVTHYYKLSITYLNDEDHTFESGLESLTLLINTCQIN